VFSKRCRDRFLKRFLKLLLRVHHNGSVPGNGFSPEYRNQLEEDRSMNGPKVVAALTQAIDEEALTGQYHAR